ncbi:marine proteobacterial sortase target protein [Brumicola blandensis]|uniref:Marine proteobacterial sortase target protein n=1 Tax=Brumicola blandensis TaxID=3075611 RepID=A0AAW8R5J6_9ALTE|nr:marine proteobacterial sortase target protein [Alteromonas sp. W409]MDT0584319.1 marine proteobacterial sortase target protein [Alteromonas sp. W409]
MSSLQKLFIFILVIGVVSIVHAIAPSMFTPALSTAMSASAASISKDEKRSINLIATQNVVNINEANPQLVHINDYLAENGLAQQPYRSPYENTESGQFYFMLLDDDGKTAYLPSPQLKTDVAIKVTGMIARASVTQTFTNNSENWLDGLYVFPLPENAAVDRLLMKVGDRSIEGVIKQKDEAKKVYQKAKQAGKKASLIEQQRPNMFTNKVANIGPGETIEVQIEYQQLLSYKDSAYSLRFPLSITPRYKGSFRSAINEVEESPIPNTNIDKGELANEQDELSLFSDRISLSVELDLGTSIRNIESEHHPIHQDISSGKQGDRYLISLANEQVVLKDFVLNWQPELGSTPTTSHFRQWVNGSEYGLIMIYPPLPDEQINADREVVFVLDTSGSMAGEAIVQAKQALAFAVDDLAASDKFNIIQFNSHAELMWKESKFADIENKAEAFDFISELEANGGTEMHHALAMALTENHQPSSANSELFTPDNSPSKMFKQVLFITDGSVSNEHSLMQFIEQNIGEQRLFTVGIGSAPNAYFMTEAAKAGKGTFTFIGDTQKVNEKMRALLHKIKSPALTNIQLNLKGLEHYSDFEMFPTTISDLYKSEPLIISYKQAITEETPRLHDANTPLLVAKYNQQVWHFTPSETSPSKSAGINVLWAREKIAQLTRDKRKVNMSTTQNADNLIATMVDDITQTALEHHIVSQYTSLVAVDVVPSAPTHMPKDGALLKGMLAQKSNQQMGRLPQTASQAELRIVIGILLLSLGLLFLYRKGIYRAKKGAY